MRTHSNSWQWALAAGLLFMAGVAPIQAADAKKKGGPKKDPASREVADFFAATNVLRIKIEIPPEGIKQLSKYQWQWGEANTNKIRTLGTVREGSMVYSNVEIQLKGAAGSFRSVDQNPALTLNFARKGKGQRFHGLEKLSLNNSVQDSTYVNEKFSREMFLKAGIPTPRATHATVELNGRDLGLYVLVEGFNWQFVSHYFKNVEGNLYDGGFLKEITDVLDTNSGDHPQDQTDRLALAKAAQESNRTNRLAKLNEILDVDRFLTYLAMDIMLWNWDGYALNKNNWRLYHDKDKGRMVFFPHGLDQMFWKPDGPIFPGMQGLVARAALEIPELRRRYLDRVAQLRKTVFQAETMTNRVFQIAKLVNPILAAKNKEEGERHWKDVENFAGQIVERTKQIDLQLESLNNLPKFDGGLARLTGWKSRADFADPLLEESAGPDGTKHLRIAAKTGSCIGAWTTRLWLEEGKYTIEGKVRTHAVSSDPGDPRGGALLRVAGRRPAKRLLGDSDWQTYSFEFDVKEPLANLELVCELRAANGEALFDLDSLRLVKK